MALCINCNIAIRGNHQYHYNAMDMSPEVVSIIEEWTAHEVADGDNICQECLNLLTIELKNRNEGNIGNRQLGHQVICISCGLSISRQTRRCSRHLRSGTAEHAYVANTISPRQIPTVTQVCNACWQRAHYHVRYREQEIITQVELPAPESGSSSVPDPLSEPSSEIPELKSEPGIQEASSILSPGYSRTPDTPTHCFVPECTNTERQRVPEIPEFKSEPGIQEASSILLPGYSRTPDTSTHCFVPECTNAKRQRVPLYLRKKILTDCKIFVTFNARVCESHLVVCNFDFLNNFEFMPDFTPSVIVEMLDLLRKPTSGVGNFENIENEHENIRSKYL